LLFVLVKRLVHTPGAMVAAIVFALHPVQHETVALLAARNDSMAAFFTLATIIVLLERTASPLRLLGGGVLFFLALLSKESAMLVPLLLACLDWGRWGRLGQKRRFLVLILCAVGIVALRRAVGVSSAGWPDPSAWSKVFGVAPEITGTYLGMLFWPWPLTPARHIDYLQPLAVLWPFLVLGMAAFFLLAHKGRQRSLVWVGLLWALFSFAPSVFATLDKGTVGERYLYLPMAGLCLALAAALPNSKKVVWWAAIVGLIGGSVMFVRNAAWKDSTSLWRSAYAAAPSAYTAGGLAWYVENIEKDLEGARKLYMEALESDPPYLQACISTVMIHLKLKRPESAAKVAEWGHRERGCPLDPMYVDQYLLGLAGSEQWEKAEREIASRPKGVTPVGITILTAFAAKKRDVALVRRFLGQWKEPAPLVPQAAKLLRLSGDPQSSEWLITGAIPPSARGQ
jgi:protein O-mannosyl-transferase